MSETPLKAAQHFSAGMKDRGFAEPLGTKETAVPQMRRTLVVAFSITGASSITTGADFRFLPFQTILRTVSEKAARTIAIVSRHRVMRDGEIALGPGKVELLRQIRSEGSIQQAAKRMDLSYMRAWTLVRTMNDCFREPLVTAQRGGSKQGGAALTEAGIAVLALYEQIEHESRRATKASCARLQKLLRP